MLDEQGGKVPASHNDLKGLPSNGPKVTGCIMPEPLKQMTVPLRLTIAYSASPGMS